MRAQTDMYTKCIEGSKLCEKYCQIQKQTIFIKILYFVNQDIGFMRSKGVIIFKIFSSIKFIKIFNFNVLLVGMMKDIWYFLKI